MVMLGGSFTAEKGGAADLGYMLNIEYLQKNIQYSILNIECSIKTRIPLPFLSGVKSSIFNS